VRISVFTKSNSNISRRNGGGCTEDKRKPKKVGGLREVAGKVRGKGGGWLVVFASYLHRKGDGRVAREKKEWIPRRAERRLRKPSVSKEEEGHNGKG